jgi:hypothetical protein
VGVEGRKGLPSFSRKGLPSFSRKGLPSFSRQRVAPSGLFTAFSAMIRGGGGGEERSGSPLLPPPVSSSPAPRTRTLIVWRVRVPTDRSNTSAAHHCCDSSPPLLRHHHDCGITTATHIKLQTLNPTPYTLNPKRQPPTSKPYTLHPTPYTLNLIY